MPSIEVNSGRQLTDTLVQLRVDLGATQEKLQAAQHAAQPVQLTLMLEDNQDDLQKVAFHTALSDSPADSLAFS